MVTACSSWQASLLTPAPITADKLLEGDALKDLAHPGEPIAEDAEVLAPSEAMKAFAARHVDPKASDVLRLDQLVTAVIAAESFGVEYDRTTRTAAETFQARRGNCLSFSSLFVSLARHVGLDARFQEVDVPPDWSLDNDTYVLNRHVNVYLDLRPIGVRVVDFNIGDFRASYDMRVISDARALAHYYNNLGVERMHAGDAVAALRCFRRAIAGHDERFSPAWTNLGTLYLRTGHPAHAEACYLEALRANAADLVAMSNLTRLYELGGRQEQAHAMRRRVAHHRMLNPYYRFELARKAYAAGELVKAISHLKVAIRKQPREDRFYFLLGLSYLQRRQETAARRWLARAREVAVSEALKNQYSHKIEILLQAAGEKQR